MPKAPDAFRTISEVSEWLDTPTYVLRFWESRFPQIKPVKRAGGRRYYRPDDMLLLGGIKTLLHFEGNTIKGVQHVIKKRGVKHVIDLSPGLDEKVTSPETIDQSDTGAGLDSMAVLKPEGARKPKVTVIRKPATLKLTEDDKTPIGPDVLSVKAIKKKRQAKAAEDLVTEPQPEPKPDVPAETAQAATPTEEAQEQPAEAAPIEFDATLLPGPFAIRPASKYGSEDLQEIETLYYSLKMVRNNMRRVSKND
ncbi:MAG: MerR family transcriptional regulator [Rhodobacteraceae bacterium]|nr:MerR family transcriptional regulator [Paracoccaceae bacterium]